MRHRNVLRSLALACVLLALAATACASEREIPALPDDVQRSGEMGQRPTFGPEIIVTRPVITRGSNPRIHVQTLPGAVVSAELTWPNGQKADRVKTKANANGVAQLFWQLQRDPGRGRVEVRIQIEADGQRASSLAYFEVR
ncbi:MAG: hypothetical protein HY691_15915 [Chloroflexi bacterium]|nr:hypothetical protein [Chloroflexota bacterium]